MTNLLNFFLILGLVLNLVGACTDCSSCFIKKLFDFSFPEENVYNISLSRNDGSLANTVMGYGDFNNDLRTDYLTFDSASGNLLLFYYQEHD